MNKYEDGPVQVNPEERRMENTKKAREVIKNYGVEGYDNRNQVMVDPTYELREELDELYREFAELDGASNFDKLMLKKLSKFQYQVRNLAQYVENQSTRVFRCERVVDALCTMYIEQHRLEDEFAQLDKI